jgi:hypothetical protein
MKVPHAIPAHVIAIREENLELLEFGWGRERVPQIRLEIDRGPRQGVHNGYYGYLLNDQGAPVRGSRFVVKHRTSDRTYGHIPLKIEFARMHRQVAISRQGVPRATHSEPARLVKLQQATAGGYRCWLNKGSWDAKIDRDWVVTARMGTSSTRVEFDIDKVTQTETRFLAPESMDQLKSYTDWKLERKRR